MTQVTEKKRKASEVSFFRSVAVRLRPQRLGDLMVSAGLISGEQLSLALVEHRRTGEQIGKVLIRQGAVSAVQVYQKLAEQWCLKTATAGMTLMMSFASVSTARAQSPADQGGVTYVSATTGAMRAASPRLFGSSEFRTDDVSSFTKWTGMFVRFEGELKTQSDNKQMRAWKSKLATLKGKSQAEQIRSVNDYMNAVRYVSDSRNFGKSDYWQTPTEFFAKGGDCEDYAIAKYISLRTLGFSNDQLRIAIVHDEVKNIPHAVLVVYTDEGTFVLDNQDKRVRRSEDVKNYRPIFSINRGSWWLHKPATA